MPLPMVHLSVAQELLDSGFKVSDLPQFYLGCISPDAIHMRKNSDKMQKGETHLIPEGKKWKDVDEKDYTSFMLNFIRANENRTKADFLRGYGIHILTDMYWVKQVYEKHVENYQNDPSPVHDLRPAYYNDTDILDQMLYNEKSWRKDVWAHLAAADCFGFLDLLTAEEIRQWKERTLGWFDEKDFQNNTIRYITKSDINAFITACSETLRNDLAELNRAS